MIGYNKVTGATAFFESADNREWTYVDPETNRLMGKLPGIDDPDAFDRAYVRSVTQCVACHQADPFVHNPSSMVRRGPMRRTRRSFLESAVARARATRPTT